MRKDFPLEFYFEIQNNPHHLGRVQVFKNVSGHQTEIDILTREGHKIFHHIGILFNMESEEEAIAAGKESLAKFLKKSVKDSEKT